MHKHDTFSKRKKLIWISISVAITFGIIGFLCSRISAADFKLVISDISPTILLAAFLLIIATNILRVYRFTTLLSPAKITFRPMFGGVLFCNFVASILPLGIGHFSYPILFKKNFGVPLPQGIAILLLARIFDVMAICIIFIFSAAFAQGIPSSMISTMHSISLYVMIAFLILVLVLILARFSHTFASRLQLLTDKILSRSPEFIRKCTAKFIEGLNAMESINSLFKLIKVAASSLGIWTSMYLIGYILMSDLNAGLDIATCFTGQSLTLVTTILPIQGIAGFGSFEGTWAGVFFLFGISEALAISSGIIIHLVIFVYQAILGLAGWFLSGRPRSKTNH